MQCINKLYLSTYVAAIFIHKDGLFCNELNVCSRIHKLVREKMEFRWKAYVNVLGMNFGSLNDE